MGNILAAIPKGTTMVAALRVSQIAALEGSWRGQPGFEKLDEIMAKAKACGLDPAKDVDLVVFAQRVTRLADGQSGDPGDARTVVFIEGRLGSNTLQECGRQLGRRVVSQQLAAGIIVLAVNDESTAYLEEVRAGGPSVLEHRLFDRHLGHVPVDALAWMWTDTRAMQRSVPDQPLPQTLLVAVRLREKRDVVISVHGMHRDGAAARVTAKLWRANAGAWRYSTSGTLVTARLAVPLTRIIEISSFVAGMLP